ncbi:MAG TPA: S8 family peptidase [Longimicrobium sp.]|nr:S8 family peptidase [Longimicrobium sp.]
MAATVLLAACADQDPTTLTAPQAAAPLMASAPDARTVPDRYIVVLKAGADAPGLAQRTANAHGGTVHFVYQAALNGFAATLPPQAVEALRHNPQVDYIERDQIMYAGATQSPATWGLDRIDQHNLPLNNTFNYTYTGSGVHVWVIDTGLRADHSEFTGRVGSAWSYVADGMGTADCGSGHGTHVAGTIGGTTYGVAKGVTIHSVRVFDCNGAEYNSSVIAGVNGVTANATQRPAVANMSLWGPASTALDNAVQNSINSGITYVVIAGNNSGANACNYSPARVAAAITVGATTSTDARASFSNIGNCIDIFAPGESITSAGISSSTATAVMSGTSMAAPHVAGAAAQYLQENPSATPATVQSTLITRATTGVLSNLGTGSPNRLVFTGTYVPPLYASIDGEGYIYVPDDNNWTYHTWTASVSGGTAPYTYQWAVSYPERGAGYANVGNETSTTFGVMASDGDLQLRLIVTSADGQSTTTYLYVNVAGPGAGCGPGVIIC